MPIPIGSGVYVKLDAVKDSLTGSPLASGTCGYVVNDSLGTMVTSGSMPYQNTDGMGANYLGSIAATVTATFSPSLGYNITITFSQSIGSYGYVVVLPESAIIPQG